MQPKVPYLSIAATARQCPNRPCPNTVWRWCRKGVKGRNGETIRLRHVRAGGKIFIPEDAIEEFFRRTAEADAAYFAESPKPSPADSPRRSTDAREKAIDNAEAALERAGA